VSLLAFAAERNVLLYAVLRRRCCCWPTGTALSSKPAAAECGGQTMGQTDRRTDAGPFHRPCSAYYASNFGANPPIGASGQMDET